MTNSEIIIATALQENIFTKEEVMAYLEQGKMIPLHTYKTWESLGYRPKKGSHACTVAKLWRFTEQGKESHMGEDEDGENRPHYYLTRCYLFSDKQVVPIKKEDL